MPEKTQAGSAPVAGRSKLKRQRTSSGESGVRPPTALSGRPHIVPGCSSLKALWEAAISDQVMEYHHEFGETHH